MKAKRFFVILLTLCMILAMVPSAAFSASRVIVWVGVTPPNGGYATDSAYYTVGSVVTLTATPDPGYTFQYWFERDSDPLFVTTENPYSFRATREVTMVAAFRKNGAYSVASPDFATSPTSHEDGILEISPIKDFYDPGDVITLSATPADGYRFYKFAWGVDNGGSSADTTYEFIDGNTFTMPASDVWLRAVFYADTPHTLTVSTDEHSTATLSPQKATYREGDEVTLTVGADDGYMLSIENLPQDYRSDADGVYTFKMINNDLTISVTSRPRTSYHISFIKSGDGSVQASMDEMTGVITASAEAGEGYQFAGWFNYNDSQHPVLLSANNPYSFTPTETVLVLAFFLPPLLTVNKSTNITHGTLDVSPAGPYYFEGDTITLTGHPDDGYMVDAYYYAPVSNLTNLTELAGNTFDMPGESVAVTVVFTPLYTIGVTASPAAGGTVEGGGDYKDLTAATVIATPEDGYRFVNWTEGGNEVSTDAEYTFLASADRNLVANFVAEHAVSVTADPAAGGTATGGGTFTEGATATLTATPKTGYRFVNWTEGATIVSTEATYSFAVAGARTLVAHFTDVPPADFAVSVSANPANGGTVAGGGTYTEGTSATVTASAVSGFEFLNWTEGGTEVSTDASYAFPATAARDLVANFGPVAGYGTLQGSGTAGDPYRIGTAANLATFRDIVNGTGNYAGNGNNGACAVLTADIDLGGDPWTPISNGSSDYYVGTFDGAGHTISGLNCSSVQTGALFGSIGTANVHNGLVRNLTVEGAVSVSAAWDLFLAGGIACYNFGTIENCHCSVDVTATANGKRGYTGGIVAYNRAGTVRQCSSSGTILTTGLDNELLHTGGIVGYHQGGTVTDCLNTGAVTSSGSSRAVAGGIAGSVFDNATVTNCASRGSVSGVMRTGGSFGSVQFSTATGCYHNIATAGTEVALASNNSGNTENVKGLSADDYANVSSYPSFDFTNVWFMSASGPRLRSMSVPVGTWAALQSALNTATSGKTIFLTADVTAGANDTYLSMPAGRRTTLDLNGHTVDRHKTSGATDGYVIRVNGALTISDSSGNDSGMITGGYNNCQSNDYNAYGGGVYVSSGGSLRLDGGKITNNKVIPTGTNLGYGGGVYMEGGASFVMNGGSIDHNISNSDGGGVCAGDYPGYSSFIMNGGVIANNQVTRSISDGGGVYVTFGSFTMNGGTITGNTSSSCGGVFIGQAGSFTMTGGRITDNNRAVKLTVGTFHISGDPVIKDNTDFNVYLGYGQRITVDDTLEDTAQIGVKMSAPGVITSGLNGNGTVSNFLSDDTSRSVSLNAAGEAVLSVNVTLNPGDHMTKSSGGDASQSVPAGSAITAVVYTAESGYCFPSDYATDANGVTVTRDSVSKITVSGAPSTDTTIDLPAPGLKTDADTPELVPVQPAVIDGTGSIPTTDVHEISTDNATWTACTGETAGLAPGTYYVRVKATETANASPAQTITINAFVPTEETTPAVTFTATGPNSGTLTGLEANGLHVLNGAGLTNLGILSANGSYTIAAGLEAGSFTIVRKGDNATTVDSGAQTITVTKAETPALTATQPAAINATGSIPTTAVHEISTDGATWTACTGETTGLKEGAYYVRVKAVGTMLASDTQTIIINAYVAPGEEAPGAAFNATGRDSGTISGLVAKANYTVGGAGIDDGTVFFADKDGIINLASGLVPGTLSIVKNGNTTTTVNSDARMITLTFAEPPALVATQPAVIDGTGSIPTTAAHEFSTDGTNWTACTGETAGLAPGTYYVRVKAAGTELASDAQTITLTAYVPGQEVTPVAVFVANGHDSGTLSGLVANANYTIGGAGIDADTAITAGADGTYAIASGLTAGTLSVVKKGNDTTTIDSAAETITITKAEVPQGIKATACTTVSNNDGTITGVDPTMEYRGGGAADWKPVKGDPVRNLLFGDYEVRVAASGTALASESVSVRVEGSSFDPDAAGIEIRSGEPISQDELNNLIAAGKPLTVAGEDGAAVVLGPEALKGIVDQAVGPVTVTLEPATPDGSEPGTVVYDLSVTAGGKTITDFGGKAELKLPYELETEKNPKRVTVWTLDEDGKPVKLESAYDPETGTVSVDADGSGRFFVGYDPFPYTDVAEDDYFFDAVDWADIAGITEGVDEDSFAPESACTRAQMVTFLWRAAGMPEPTIDGVPFTDVDPDAYYYKALLWAYENGITEGVTASTFDPDGEVNRAQAVTFLFRALASQGGVTISFVTLPFTDVPDGEYFTDAVKWAYENGITEGVSPTSFDPYGDCLRAHAVTFLYRAFHKEGNENEGGIDQ